MQIERIRAILEKIKEYNRIAIFRHKRPDGDATGSTKGLQRILKLTFPEKEIYLIDEDTAAYLDFVNRPTGSNMAYLVGHGNLRACVVGYADRKLTAQEQAEMEELLRKCLKAGALGLSFGLIYPPGSYADTEEMIGLAKVVAEFGALITVHVRSENTRLVEAVEEMMQVTRATNVRMVISHHKAMGKETQKVCSIGDAQRENYSEIYSLPIGLKNVGTRLISVIYFI